MKLLQEKIIKDGMVLAGDVLRVDSFLNHQLDPQLMLEMGKEFAKFYAEKGITKILTIESSGIAVALMTGIPLEVPVIFARKKKSITMTDDIYVSQVYSFTKKETNDITVSRKFISEDDVVLIIDDFLANGAASFGLISIVEQAGAKVAGLGIVIEKSFQDGGKKLRAAGYTVHSLARIKSLEHQHIIFEEEAIDDSEGNS